MTCTLYTSQYRPQSNETSTCKYYLAGKTNQNGVELLFNLLKVKIIYYFLQ